MVIYSWYIGSYLLYRWLEIQLELNQHAISDWPIMLTFNLLASYVMLQHSKI